MIIGNIDESMFMSIFAYITSDMMNFSLNVFLKYKRNDGNQIRIL